VVWSLYNHHANASECYYKTVNETPGRIGPPLAPPVASIRQYFLEWLARDGYPYWPFWENIKSWWDIRHLPNVLLLHYANLTKNMPGEIRRIATFLDIDIDPKTWPVILEHCSMDYMRAHGDRIVPLEGAFWTKGARTFIHKGTNGRWKQTLTDDDIRLYRDHAIAVLGVECARWLETGTGMTASGNTLV
tara:strand:+ start:290 stop:859 length:570 start_codon:yes stop_codon:yes gene_type:complete